MIFNPSDLGTVAGGANENSIQPAVTSVQLPGLPYPSNLSPGSASTYMGKSGNSMTIGTGSHSFTASTGLPYVPGMVVDIASTAGAANHMMGQVTAYNSSTGAMTVNATTTGGSGSFSSWYVYGWYQALPPFSPPPAITPPTNANAMAMGYDSTNQNLYVLSTWAASDWSPMVYVYHVNDSGTVTTDTVTPGITSGQSGYGSISPSTAQTVTSGNPVSFTVTPVTGVIRPALLIPADRVGRAAGLFRALSYSVPSVTANCARDRNFAIDPFTITPTAGSNGSISPSTAQSVIMEPVEPLQ